MSCELCNEFGRSSWGQGRLCALLSPPKIRVHKCGWKSGQQLPPVIGNFLRNAPRQLWYQNRSPGVLLDWCLGTLLSFLYLWEGEHLGTLLSLLICRVSLWLRWEREKERERERERDWKGVRERDRETKRETKMRETERQRERERDKQDIERERERETARK